MLAILIDGYGLAAIIIVSIAVIALAAIALRLLRDQGVRVARIGVFIERQRVAPPSEKTEDE